MMKKIISYLVIVGFLFITFTPIVKADNKTLKDYKDKVAELERQKKENQKISSETEAKIDSMRNAILEANNKISSNETKVENSKQLVAASQEKIKLKTKELKELIQVLQYSNINSEEVYIDYVFDSSSISEMIERQAVVEQIITYTQNELDGLNKLVKDNEELQVKLNNDNVVLTNSITEYEKKEEELHHYLDSVASIGMDVEEELQAQKKLVQMFEKAGCKDNDSLDDCYYNKKLGSSSFSRPLKSGRVSQAWNASHAGIDLAVSKGTPVYAPANGTVAATVDGIAYYKRTGNRYCGGNIIYMHHTVGGKPYTTEYGHLTSIYVKPGQYVTKGTIIGTTGGDRSTFYYDRCTSGAHLHYAIANGYYLVNSEDGYLKHSTFKSKTQPTSQQKISGLKSQKGWTWSTLG